MFITALPAVIADRSVTASPIPASSPMMLNCRPRWAAPLAVSEPASSCSW